MVTEISFVEKFVSSDPKVDNLQEGDHIFIHAEHVVHSAWILF